MLCCVLCFMQLEIKMENSELAALVDDHIVD